MQNERLSKLLHQTTNVQVQQLIPNYACGIVGYIGPGEAHKYLLDGLKILESRGYDSAGITTINNEHHLVTTKFASLDTTSDSMKKLQQFVPSRHTSHNIGIAHTRWATHGGKTDANAHPHHDCTDRIAVVHNGIIENYAEIKAKLIAEGIQFSSETDTEVIAQLIGIMVRAGKSTYDAVKEAVSQMQGTWGLVVIDRDSPDQLIAAKNGSPMLIGIGKGRMFIASESSAFSQQTKEFIALEDGEIAVIGREGCSLDISRVEIAPNEKIETSPAPYEHWTLKEILEQPLAVSKALNFGGRILGDSDAKLGGLDANEVKMLSVENLVIAACGTSFYAGLYAEKIMQSLSSFNTVNVIDASEVTHDSIPHRTAGMLVISQSGETKDVQRALLIADEIGVPTFSVVNIVRSLIARSTGCGVYLNAGREFAVASTKAFTCQVTVLALIAIWFSARRGTSKERLERRKQLVEALHRLSTNIGMTLYRTHTKCKELAQLIKGTTSCFILGKGFAEPIAKEGALKIKEITYVHAEGYPGGALKHGPFALITKGVPVILIILTDIHQALMKTALEEVHGRGATTIVITNDPSPLTAANHTILIPSNGPLTALLAVLPLQLLAYELALARGNENPDKPRNLAKTVTVD